MDKSPELKEAQKGLAVDLKDVDKESSVLFNVITKAEERHKNKSDFFVITSNDHIADRKDNEVKNSQCDFSDLK